jgi:hypothetical protein
LRGSLKSLPVVPRRPRCPSLSYSFIVNFLHHFYTMLPVRQRRNIIRHALLCGKGVRDKTTRPCRATARFMGCPGVIPSRRAG